MFTPDMIEGTAAEAIRLEALLARVPTWRWGNPITGDALLRADDKAFHLLAGHPDELAAAVSSIRDEAARAEIRAHAERRCAALAAQLADARSFHLDSLTPAAERELADQRRYLALIAEPHD